MILPVQPQTAPLPPSDESPLLPLVAASPDDETRPWDGYDDDDYSHGLLS